MNSKLTLNLLNKGLKVNTGLTSVYKRNFGLISEYNDRKNKKLTKAYLVDEKPQYFITSARPGNFGEHLDFKVNLDNWFDENRVWNEHEMDIKRT